MWWGKSHLLKLLILCMRFFCYRFCVLCSNQLRAPSKRKEGKWCNSHLQKFRKSMLYCLAFMPEAKILFQSVWMLFWRGIHNYIDEDEISSSYTAAWVVTCHGYVIPLFIIPQVLRLRSPTSSAWNSQCWPWLRVWPLEEGKYSNRIFQHDTLAGETRVG